MSFYHYILPLFVSHCLFYLEVYFVWYKYGRTCFLLLAIWLEYHFPSLHSEAMFVFKAEMYFLEAAYCWVLFFNPSSHSVFWLEDSINLYLEWLLIYEGLILPFYLLFSGCSIFPLFVFHSISDCHFSLVVFCDGFLSLLFIYELWFCSDFLFSGYHEVCIKYLIDDMVHFLIASYLH